MRLFLDTSTLVKLYHNEMGSDEIQNLFSHTEITTIFLSDISKIEVISTIWKKVRTREINTVTAIKTIDLFEADSEKYSFIPIDSIIIEQAKKLANRYGMQGLRTLDSIQLATALFLFDQTDISLSDDKLLKSLFESEGLVTQLPG